MLNMREICDWLAASIVLLKPNLVHPKAVLKVHGDIQAYFYHVIPDLPLVSIPSSACLNFQDAIGKSRHTCWSHIPSYQLDAYASTMSIFLDTDSVPVVGLDSDPQDAATRTCLSCEIEEAILRWAEKTRHSDSELRDSTLINDVKHLLVSLLEP
jgi:hypothetical protein